MAVSVTGPRAVNELGGPIIPGSRSPPALKSHFDQGYVVKMQSAAVTLPYAIFNSFEAGIAVAITGFWELVIFYSIVLFAIIIWVW